MFDASPSELDTVYTVLNPSLAMGDQPHDATVVFDQAINAKVMKIVWKRPEEFNCIVICISLLTFYVHFLLSLESALEYRLIRPVSEI